MGITSRRGVVFAVMRGAETFAGVANYIVEKQYRDIEKERENWSFNVSTTDMQTVFECARSTCLPNARVVATSCLWLMYQQLSG